MTANALRDASESLPASTDRRTDDAVQASLARLMSLVESAREQAAAASRSEADTPPVAARPTVSAIHAPVPEAAPVPASAPEVVEPPQAAPERSVSPAVATADLEDLSKDLAGRIAAATAELEERLRALIESRVEGLNTALAQTQEEVRAVEQRSSRAVDELSRGITDTHETLTSLRSAERHGAEAFDRLSAEVAQLNQSADERLARLESSQTQALETLDAELTRIQASLETSLRASQAAQTQALERLDAKLGRNSQRLAERIAGAEWRSSQAAEERGEEMVRANVRLGEDLIERIRLSEERATVMLAQACDQLERRAASHVAEPDQLAAPGGEASDGEVETHAWSESPGGEAVPVMDHEDGREPVEPELAPFPEPLAALEEPAEQTEWVHESRFDTHAEADAQASQSTAEEAPKPEPKRGFWSRIGI